MYKWGKTKYIAIMGLFSAIIFLLAFTPIGFIRLPFMAATIVHIPVIVGSILLGPLLGGILGFIFGLTSLINATMAPGLTSFAFSPFIPMPASGQGSLFALPVCFIPRILAGVLPWLVYNGLQKISSKKYSAICLALAGIAGSLANTLLVMNFIFVFFRDEYAFVRNVAAEAVYALVLAAIAANGIPEAIVAAIITAALGSVINVARH